MPNCLSQANKRFLLGARPGTKVQISNGSKITIYSDFVIYLIIVKHFLSFAFMFVEEGVGTADP